MRTKRLVFYLFTACFMFLPACKKSKSVSIPMNFNGSESFEDYDIGNKHILESLTGRASEVCLPRLSVVENENTELSYLVYRTSDRTVLSEHQAVKKIYPASITKLMTAYLVLKYCDVNELVTFSYNASHLGIKNASVCGFAEGDSMTLSDLLTAMLISSGNDAAIAIAEHFSGSVEAFVERMNQEALRLSAVDTHFVNPHGLHDDNQYSTAYDLYLIYNELIRYNLFNSTIAADSFTVTYKDKQGTEKTKLFSSTNLFFNGIYEPPEGITITGGKTGVTNKAGCCLVLSFTDKNGASYVAEVFHAASYEELYNKVLQLLQIVAQKL